ncbi:MULTISPECIES: ArsR/SmtB family transcription factor [unclassified Candidatus Frackibacter]|uniref:ArsR/SmtB family transcription factor n=1 Tax=unclassified Candidatus Frackibacter TaxID=2648818 RepID=UPI00088B6AC5|nr:MULTISPECIES: metalloregulator ArsR/SmtB family transcription factor [unclassified Candidatus Frackibacter]SDC00352.1 transcriptional regulator, ArsR family [Candidatus Frackibacter sp. WG11]SEM31845.1 transcriptional regulator, ArsR family [Candidatus Frackibacter sp. WG12]SFL36752.1 transcriptional regulator, ArsR family [Candidatus Frackibacter sp. WG13]
MSTLISKLTSELFKALAHPTRVQILSLLRKGELCVCDIYEALELSQSNISQHLKVLKDQDLVESRKDGVMVLYKVKDDEIWEILDSAKSLLVKQINKTKLALEEEE